MKPIRGLGSFFRSSRRAASSPIALYNVSIFLLSSSSRLANRSTLARNSFNSEETDDAARRYSRTWTKTRMMAMLACMAVSLRKTEDSMATPCSVKAKGGYFGYLPIEDSFKVTNCNLILSFNALYSSWDNVNMKSSGNRSRFLRTACFKAFVSTWYNLARSKSSITFFPRISGPETVKNFTKSVKLYSFFTLLGLVEVVVN